MMFSPEPRHPGETAFASTPSRVGRAPMWPTWRRRPGLPPSCARDPGRARQWIPDYPRVSNPVDNGGAPSIDWCGRKILDAIVADPDVAVLICPITGALPSMSRPLAEDLVTSRPPPTSRSA